jgi:hypothetical protein
MRTSTKANERVANLVNEITQSNERIILPTPVLSEILVRAGAAGPRYLQEVTKSIRFKVAPFDTRAAIEVAAMLRKAFGKKDKKDGSRGTWAKVNFDRQIVAISKVEGSHTIYSDDTDLGKFARKAGLKVVTLRELDVPPSKTPLFDVLEEPGVPSPPQEA